MKAETRSHRWLYAVLTAAMLLLLLAVVDRARPQARRTGGDPKTGAPRPARLVPGREVVARLALERARDARRSQPDGSAKLAHLSDLDRTADEDHLLWTAEEELVAACMRERGFTYLPNPMDIDPDAYQKHGRPGRGAAELARVG